jgi:beta-glucosidase
MFQKKDFGKGFKWGVTISAFQNEGAAALDGKEPSIWDTFSNDLTKIGDGAQIGDASDFYHRYCEDIELARSMGFGVFRFSIAWTRVIPNGTGDVNPAGIEFYNRVIDKCISEGLEPWVTLYHWDLPQKLEDLGGWTNRSVIGWFSDFAEVCTKVYGDRVKNWIVMNEPMSFTGLGYFMGYHAPGRKGILNFLKAAHHVTLSMAEGGRVVRKNVPGCNVGVALSCSYVQPVNKWFFNRRAGKRLEALLNRFYLEPLLGLGYPVDVMPALNMIRTFFEPGDDGRLSFDFDFYGVQYYFRIVAQFSLNPPILFANEVSPTVRATTTNEMGMDVYPKGMYKVLQFFASYPQIKKLIITESGTCHVDYVRGDKVNDAPSRKYHQKVLKQVLKAKNEKIPVEGYFVWSLTDNFEWSEGYKPKFGLVHVDFTTQKRTIKVSGKWFRDFLVP